MYSKLPSAPDTQNSWLKDYSFLALRLERLLQTTQQTSLLDYTLPAWRGKGIATSLLNEILSFAQRAEIKRLWLNASPGGKPLYQKTGFVSIPNGMELRFD